VEYEISGNTHSSDKTNFWQFVEGLLGVSLSPDIGLTGNGLSGQMKSTGQGDWRATGIPITPMNDRVLWIIFNLQHNRE